MLQGQESGAKVTVSDEAVDGCPGACGVLRLGEAHVMRTPVLAPDVANPVNAGVSFAPQFSTAMMNEPRSLP
jgi:hypothetical protein